MINMMSNVNFDDIKQIEKELGVSLTPKQRQTILQQYQKVVMDRAEGWNTILKDLILNLK
jgi:hypothetical protein